MTKRNTKFPPLVKDSKVNLHPLNVCSASLAREYALAAAEWQDVADNPENHNKATGLVLRATRLVKEWHNFRKENCK